MGKTTPFLYKKRSVFYLQKRVPNGLVEHPWRRLQTSTSIRDIPLECPSDIIDQIGGWQTAGAGQRYGRGYELDILHNWLKKAVGDHTKLA